MHVALVDPSNLSLKILKAMLEEHGDIVYPFNDGLEACNFITSEPKIDLLLSSLELPSLSGLELCWEINLLKQAHRHIYAIAMSSTRDKASLIEALDCGADDFIYKPLEAQELYARLRTAERLAFMQKELITLATTDPLTGVKNRRAFFAEGETAVSNASTQDPLSVIMLDIDHFKKVNDTYGHDIGDIVICKLAKISSWDGAILGRLGGEEFALIFAGMNLEKTAEIAEALRQKILELSVATDKGEISFSCSFGVAEQKSNDTVDSLLKRADEALYDAKSNGRNQVMTR